jgi:hypothetical protein
MRNLQEPLLRWFASSHLPPHLSAASAPFGELAARLIELLEPSAERTVALRRLLEAKDAAVRAAIETAERRATASVNHIEPKEG